MVFIRIRQMKILKIEDTERESLAGHYKMKFSHVQSLDKCEKIYKCRRKYIHRDAYLF